MKQIGLETPDSEALDDGIRILTASAMSLGDFVSDTEETGIIPDDHGLHLLLTACHVTDRHWGQVCSEIWAWLGKVQGTATPIGVVGCIHGYENGRCLGCGYSVSVTSGGVLVDLMHVGKSHR